MVASLGLSSRTSNLFLFPIRRRYYAGPHRGRLKKERRKETRDLDLTFLHVHHRPADKAFVEGKARQTIFWRHSPASWQVGERASHAMLGIWRFVVQRDTTKWNVVLSSAPLDYISLTSSPPLSYVYLIQILFSFCLSFLLLLFILLFVIVLDD